MPDVLQQTNREITRRLAELKPTVEEYQRLRAAADALARINGTPARKTRTATRKRGPGRPKGASTRRRTTTTATAKTAAKRKPGRKATATAGRPKGSGTRAAEAQQLVRAQPGITIPELATRMGIKQNYLYRVMPGLQKERKVKKQGRGWDPAR